MNPPTLEQIIRRVVGAAFDAGLAAAIRPADRRARAREDQVEYGFTLLRAHIEAEAARAPAPVPPP